MKRILCIILVIVSLIVCMTGCTQNAPNTEPQPLEPESNEFDVVVKKPVIYLYPEELMFVNVILEKPEIITCSYPDYYYYGWGVMAYPNGDLVDEKTGRELYSLYYECETLPKVDIAIRGFVVAKEDTTAFLEEKLAILGLNEHEAQEFIIYWLPQLLKNNYNYIRFASQDEIEEIMPITVKPTPDTIIRVLMYFKGLDSPMKVAEQTLTPVQREGFTVVEWGGTELQNVVPWKIRLPQPDIKIPPVRLPRLGDLGT